MVSSIENRLRRCRGNDAGTGRSHGSVHAASTYEPLPPYQAPQPRSRLWDFFARRLFREPASPAAPSLTAPDSNLDEGARQARAALCRATESLLKASNLSNQLVFGELDEHAVAGRGLLGPEMCVGFATAIFAAGAAATTVDLALAARASKETRKARHKAAARAAAKVFRGSESLRDMPMFGVRAGKDPAMRQLVAANQSILQVAKRIELVVAFCGKQTSDASAVSTETTAILRALDAVQSANTAISFVLRAARFSLDEAAARGRKRPPVAFESARAAAEMAIYDSVIIGMTEAAKLIRLSAMASQTAAGT